MHEPLPESPQLHSLAGIFNIGYSLSIEEYGLALTAFIGFIDCTYCSCTVGILTVVNSKQEVLGCPKSGPRGEHVVKKVFLLTYYIS